VPFCLRKCPYCDFLSFPYQEALAEEFLRALKVEMGLHRGLAPESIYIGGGTPTVLSAQQLQALLGALRESFPTGPSVEFTVEANPATLDEAKCALLREAGVGRLSLGLQALRDELLSALGRLHGRADALAAVRLARAAGFEDISVDLIYGIPGQGLRDWEETLGETVALLGPQHISAYELTAEEGTPFHESLRKGLLRMPPEDEIAEMFLMAHQVLEAAGYGHYEVSNYALRARECRHNLNYWRRGPYLGLGPGAHSFLQGRRWRNTPDLGLYIQGLLREGRPPKEDVHVLEPQEEAREFLMLGLRLREGISLKEASELYGLGGLLRASEPLLREGFLGCEGGRLRPTVRGMLALNQVLLRLFGALGL